MALTRTGRKSQTYTDPSGYDVQAVTVVDGNGKATLNYLGNDDTPALSTTYALVTLTSAGMPPGQTAPTSDVPALLNHLHIVVNTIASSAAALTVKVTTDAAGDDVIYTSAATTMTVGEGTATDGCIDLSIDAPGGRPFFPNAAGLYVWIKTDTGTCTAETVYAFWRTA